MPPLFSIGVTTYNRSEMLAECLHSIIAQSFTDYEVIVGNDYLGERLLLSDYSINDSRFRIVNHKENLGEVNNMNWLLEQAVGKYFIWMADDDLMHPEFLNQVNLALSRSGQPAPAAIYTGYDSGPKPTEFCSIDDDDVVESVCYPLVEFMCPYLSGAIGIIGCYGAMRTDLLRRIGGMRRLGVGFGPYSDTILPLLLAEMGTILYLNTGLVFLRTHNGSLSASSSDFNAYTTAEDDFMRLFDLLCVRNNLTGGGEKIVLIQCAQIDIRIIAVKC